MTSIVLKEDKTIEVDSSNCENAAFDFNVENDSVVIIKITGDKLLNLQISATVQKDRNFSLLLLNNNNQKVVLNDSYNLFGGCKANIAYSLLNASGIDAVSNYELLGPYADLRIVSASVTSQSNKLNQNILHSASNTKANADNYGIVLKAGKCELVVKNSIHKGFKQCETHQTSRLLTYDKSSIGKILPILIIDDNDVIASHACSLGQPDENQIYYLMSRGLSKQEALNLITIGYLMPITQIVDNDEINTILKKEIETKVNGNV